MRKAHVPGIALLRSAQQGVGQDPRQQNRLLNQIVNHALALAGTTDYETNTPGWRVARQFYMIASPMPQCYSFLDTFKGVKITRCANTAAAAKLVAESGRTDLAALCSRNCIELYDLDCLAEAVQNQQNNYTRFICISRNLEIYPGADRTSLMMVLPHRAGSLYKVLARFYAQNINLIKLESRPMPDRDFEFMFYFDLETSVYSPEFIQLMGELQTISEEFKYLGSYSEVV